MSLKCLFIGSGFPAIILRRRKRKKVYKCIIGVVSCCSFCCSSINNGQRLYLLPETTAKIGMNRKKMVSISVFQHGNAYFYSIFKLYCCPMFLHHSYSIFRIYLCPWDRSTSKDMYSSKLSKPSPTLFHPHILFNWLASDSHPKNGCPVWLSAYSPFPRFHGHETASSRIIGMLQKFLNSSLTDVASTRPIL